MSNGAKKRKRGDPLDFIIKFVAENQNNQRGDIKKFWEVSMPKKP